jgi:hypothetical protein
MKKTLIALLFVGSSSALLAQTVTDSTDGTNNNNTTIDNSANPTMDNSTNTTPNDMNTNQNSMSTTTDSINTSVSTGNYSAYGTVAVDVPATVRYSFQKDYPNVTGAQWYQTPNGQLRVMYKDMNNQDMDVYYYGTSAQSYMVSLPVRQSLTPDDIITKAKSMFGMSIYDINRVKAANNEDVYHVRLLDNGQVRSVWISEQGTEVAAADVFRTADAAGTDVINEVNTSTNEAAPNSNANLNDNTSETNNTTTTDNTNSVDNTTTPSADNTTTQDNSGSTETKTKIKSSDGTKIKSKEGEIKVK